MASPVSSVLSRSTSRASSVAGGAGIRALYARGGGEVRQPGPERLVRAAGAELDVEEQPRRRRAARAHAAAELRRDASGGRLAAPVGVEARAVEPEPLRAGPQMR